MGAFALPSVLLGACSMPFVWNRWKRQNSGVLRRVVLACTAVAVVLLAWIDFCMAGILLRYMLDILVILSVFSTILLLQVPALLKSYHVGLARVSEKVIAAAMVGTVDLDYLRRESFSVQGTSDHLEHLERNFCILEIRKDLH